MEADPPVAPRTLGDHAAVGVAALVWFASLHPNPLPPILGFALAVTAILRRRPLLLALGLLLAASGLSQRAHAGLTPPRSESFDGVVTLVSDPVETPFGARADVRVDRRRLELTTTGAPAGSLLRSAMGQRIAVGGRIGPPATESPWLVPRHVAGRLVATRIERHDDGSAPYRAANRFRRLLLRSAESLEEPNRSLYGGFVLGDRGQRAETVDDFRGSGLTHRLVVSGANVAFVLLLISPITKRLGLLGRWVVTLSVIASFGLVTRFEPSVLRASTMAAISVTGGLLGRPASGLRTLALAVTALVLIDPLLVHAVGFQLSVAASFGITAVGTPIVDRLPGPHWFRDSAAVTVAAQVGVLPVILLRFGGLPVAAFPANLIAVPTAGLITIWGLPAGIVGGLLGEPVASILHRPTDLFIAWVEGTARIAAAAPLGELGVREAVLAVASGGAALWMRGRGRDRPVLRRALAGICVLALLAPAVALRRPQESIELTGGGRLHRGGGATVLVVDGRPHLETLLSQLRQAGVRRIDVVAWTGDPDGTVLRTLHHRWAVDRQLRLDDPPTSWQVGGLLVTGGGGAEPEVIALTSGSVG